MKDWEIESNDDLWDDIVETIVSLFAFVAVLRPQMLCTNSVHSRDLGDGFPQIASVNSLGIRLQETFIDFHVQELPSPRLSDWAYVKLMMSCN